MEVAAALIYLFIFLLSLRYHFCPPKWLLLFVLAGREGILIHIEGESGNNWSLFVHPIKKTTKRKTAILSVLTNGNLRGKSENKRGNFILQIARVLGWKEEKNNRCGMAEGLYDWYKEKINV